MPCLGAGALSLDKAAILGSFHAALEAVVAECDRELAHLDEAAAGETKSSAGDKYETAREMISQARRLQLQLRDKAARGIEWLSRLEPTRIYQAVAAGCLIETGKAIYLLGILTESVTVEGVVVQGLTLASPLGQALTGGRVGDCVAWRGESLEIHGLW